MPVITIGNVDIGTASDVFQLPEDVYETGIEGNTGYATHFDDYLLPTDNDEKYNEPGEFETIMIDDQEIVGKVVEDDGKKYLDLLDEDGNPYLVADTAEELAANLELFAQTADPESDDFAEIVQAQTQQALTAVDRINVSITLEKSDQDAFANDIVNTIGSLFEISNQGDNAEDANNAVVDTVVGYIGDLNVV